MEQEYKPWDEMTDEEKAPILLAYARGEEIEWQNRCGEWLRENDNPLYWGSHPRRIKPKPEAPERVEALIHWDVVAASFCRDMEDVKFAISGYGGHVYRITRNADGSAPQIEKVEV